MKGPREGAIGYIAYDAVKTFGRRIGRDGVPSPSAVVGRSPRDRRLGRVTRPA